MKCGYCNGTVEWSPWDGSYVHVTDGERITNISPGDYVSAQHNRAGTRVNSADVVTDDEQ